MEVIFKELIVPPKAGLEVELGTYVPSAAYVGHHHQRKKPWRVKPLVFNKLT